MADYGTFVEAWCHCFRHPERFLPSQLPRALLSESDFVDYRTLFSAETIRGGVPKEFDFVYVCLPGRWREMAKNWALAKACLWRLCGELDLRGLLVGRHQILDLPFRRNVTVTGDLPPDLLWRHIKSSGFLFVPSIMDASPRLLTEALCLDVPVVVHSEILGGWKYVNSHTGAFFDTEDDVGDAALHCLEARLSPLAWYSSSYGPDSASSRLSTLLHQLDRGVAVTESLRLSRRRSTPSSGT